LISKLLEYQRFKEAASMLTLFNEKAKDVYYRTCRRPSVTKNTWLKLFRMFDLMERLSSGSSKSPKVGGQILRERDPHSTARWAPRRIGGSSSGAH